MERRHSMKCKSLLPNFYQSRLSWHDNRKCMRMKWTMWSLFENLDSCWHQISAIWHICTRKDQQTSEQMYFMLEYHTRLSRLSLQMARFFLADWRFNRLPELYCHVTWQNCCSSICHYNHYKEIKTA